MVKEESREAYASNIIVFEASDLNVAYQEVAFDAAIIWQSIGEGMFGSAQFIVKHYEDNKLM